MREQRSLPDLMLCANALRSDDVLVFSSVASTKPVLPAA